MIGHIASFNSIGNDEISKVREIWMRPLSGYLAGKERGGRFVCELEDAWARLFGVKHAIAVNSATSGLLAASFAVGLTSGDEFLCPAMTMSATVAAPMFTGARPLFCDVGLRSFQMDPKTMPARNFKAILLTNLFGLSIDEGWWRGFAHQNDAKLIVDASQSPFATCDDVLAGTVGDIGVYSLNVHKPIQCGEGGVVVTNDDSLAYGMRCFINHGENAFGGILGLNLRMPEVCAAIALAQLRRGQEITAGRVKQAEAIIAAIGNIPGITPPYVHPDCFHVYYAIPFLIERNRTEFCKALREAGVPIVEGYVPPLYRLPAFAPYGRSCPVAQSLHDQRLFYFENCAYDPSERQIEQIGAAFRKAAEVL